MSEIEDSRAFSEEYRRNHPELALPSWHRRKPTPEPTCEICGVCESWHPHTGCDQWIPDPAEPVAVPQAPERPKREQVFTIAGLTRVMYDAADMDDYLAALEGKRA